MAKLYVSFMKGNTSIGHFFKNKFLITEKD